MFACCWQAQKSVTKPVTFAPSVLSTTQMNTNFTALYKTPSATASRTPFKLQQSAKSISSNVNESMLSPADNRSLLSTSS